MIYDHVSVSCFFRAQNQKGVADAMIGAYKLTCLFI